MQTFAKQDFRSIAPDFTYVTVWLSLHDFCTCVTTIFVISKASSTSEL